MLPTGPGRRTSESVVQEQSDLHPQAFSQTPPERYGLNVPIATDGRAPLEPPETAAVRYEPLGAHRAAHGRTVTGQVPIWYAVSDASSDQPNASERSICAAVTGSSLAS